MQTWHLKVKAGVTIAKLPLSKRARRPGTYVLTWVATSGTDVAREVADIVLEDDNLETMIVAVSHGRTIYKNIKKSVQ